MGLRPRNPSLTSCQKLIPSFPDLPAEIDFAALECRGEINQSGLQVLDLTAILVHVIDRLFQAAGKRDPPGLRLGNLILVQQSPAGLAHMPGYPGKAGHNLGQFLTQGHGLAQFPLPRLARRASAWRR